VIAVQVNARLLRREETETNIMKTTVRNRQLTHRITVSVLMKELQLLAVNSVEHYYS